jgi:hypothetical protein
MVYLKKSIALFAVAGIATFCFAQKTIKPKNEQFIIPDIVKRAIDAKNIALKQKGNTFTVGYSPVYGIPLEKITGFKIPDDPKLIPKPTPLIHRPPSSYAQCVRMPYRATDRVVDMRTLGIITPPRNQGQCLSCFAFAPLAALETNILLKNGGDANALDLSEAQVLSCLYSFLGWSNNCENGGLHGYAADYMKDHRVATETDWPYEFKYTDRCGSFTNVSTPYKAKTWGYVSGSILASSPSIQQIKEAVCTYGSVSCTMRATESFKNYNTGIYDANDNGTIVPDHVVQIIGWNEDSLCWIAKNSWGDRWGEGGFFRIKYNTNVMGGYAMWVEAEDIDGPTCPRLNLTPVDNSKILPFDKVYKIINVHTTFSMEVSDPVGIEGLFGKGIKVQEWQSHGPIIGASDGHNQEWHLIPRGKLNGKDVYQLLNNGFLKYLTVKTDGTVAVDVGYGLVDYLVNQLWFIESDEPGKFLIKSASNGKYLKAANEQGQSYAMTENAENALHEFLLQAIPISSGLNNKINGAVYIQPKHATNMALDITAGNPANGTPLQLWAKMNNNANQQFIIRKMDTHYIIESTIGGGNKAVENYGFSNTGGSRMVIWDKTGGLNQQWWIIPCVRDEGKFIFINLHSGKCLDVPANGNTNGTAVNQWVFRRSDNQKWLINH